jgi:hypothetical protein
MAEFNWKQQLVLAVAAILIATALLAIFERARVAMWRLAWLPIPLAVVLVVVITFVLLLRNRQNKIAQFEKTIAQMELDAEKRAAAAKKRDIAQPVQFQPGRRYTPSKW